MKREDDGRLAPVFRSTRETIFKYAQSIPGNRFASQFNIDAHAVLSSSTVSATNLLPLEYALSPRIPFSYKSTRPFPYSYAIASSPPPHPPLSSLHISHNHDHLHRTPPSRDLPARPVQPTPTLGRFMAAVEHGVGKRASIKDTRSHGTPR